MASWFSRLFRKTVNDSKGYETVPSPPVSELERQLKPAKKHPLNVRFMTIMITFMLSCLLGFNWLLWGIAEKRSNTLLLISLDGFRYDFLERGKTPNLERLGREGVKAQMKPSFPSLTFPNHFTLVTGRYPAWHGIVGNNFRDVGLKDSFYYTEPSQTKSYWWQGEPVTA